MSTVLDTNVTADVAADQSPGRTPAGNTTSRTVRILHLINGEHYAGAERVQDLLALRLTRIRHPASIRLPQAGPIRRNTPVASDSAVSIADAVAMGFAARLALAAIVCAGRFAILHTHTPRSRAHRPDGRGICGRANGAPCAWPNRDRSPRRMVDAMDGRHRRHCLSQAAATIAVSPTAAEYMVRQGRCEVAIAGRTERSSGARDLADCDRFRKPSGR